MKLIFVYFMVLLSLVIAAPANNEVDKDKSPFINDIAGNRAKLAEVSGHVEIPSTKTPEFNPKPAGSMVARFIDDIFQIPIGVLQSVAKLLKNPFKQLHTDVHKEKTS